MGRKIVLDTDIGVDDAMALLFAHFSPRLDLVGITTTFGNASLEDTTLNALYVTERFDIPAPVYRGSPVTLSGEARHGFPQHIHGPDGLGSMRQSPPSRREASESAVDFLIRLVHEYPGEVTLVTIGRLTNVALALSREPGLAERVKELVVMGGALGRGGFGGNVTPVAEANMFGDPEAADLICRSSIPTVMVGLDVTQKTVMSERFFTELAASGEAGRFIHAMSRVYTEFHRKVAGIDGCYVHDSSAVAYAIEPELFALERGALRVGLDGIGRGQSILSKIGRRWVVDDWDGVPEKSVCVDVDSSRLLELYRATLTGS